MASTDLQVYIGAGMLAVSLIIMALIFRSEGKKGN